MMTKKLFLRKLLVGGLLGSVALNVLYIFLISTDLTLDLFVGIALIGFLVGVVVNAYRFGAVFYRQRVLDKKVDEVDVVFTVAVEEFVKESASKSFLDYKQNEAIEESFMTNEEAERKYKEWKKRLRYVAKFLASNELYMFERGFPDNAFLNSVLNRSGWMTESMYGRLIDSDRMRREYRTMQEGVKELNDRLRAYSLGNEGERVVLEELGKYGDRFKVLDGVRFSTNEAVVGQELDGKTVENDVLVFTNNGLYTLEIKNIMSEGEKYLRISKDGIWYKKTREEGSWKADPNTTKIFSQVNRQIHYTESLIERKLGKKISLKSVIVIANDNVQIENETDWLIVRPNMLFSLLNGRDVDSEDVLTDDEISELVEMFKTYDLGAGKFPARVFEKDIAIWDHNARAIESMLYFREDLWEIFDRAQRNLDRIE